MTCLKVAAAFSIKTNKNGSGFGITYNKNWNDTKISMATAQGRQIGEVFHILNEGDRGGGGRGRMRKTERDKGMEMQGGL